MERNSDRDFSRRLQDFEKIWRRVSAAGSPRETAEKHGVKLMPRQKRKCGPRR